MLNLIKEFLNNFKLPILLGFILGGLGLYFSNWVVGLILFLFPIAFVLFVLFYFILHTPR